jgi:hypothetical protein
LVPRILPNESLPGMLGRKIHDMLISFKSDADHLRSLLIHGRRIRTDLGKINAIR